MPSCMFFIWTTLAPQSCMEIKTLAEIEENIRSWEPRIKMLIEKIYWPYLKLCDNYLPSLPTDFLEFFSIGELFFSFSPEIDN